MINEITIFYGSKKDFEKYLVKEIDPNENTIPFMELIQHYNARLRPNESGVGEDALYENIDVDNCIVRADDYGSVLAHDIFYTPVFKLIQYSEPVLATLVFTYVKPQHIFKAFGIDAEDHICRELFYDFVFPYGKMAGIYEHYRIYIIERPVLPEPAP